MIKLTLYNLFKSIKTILRKLINNHLKNNINSEELKKTNTIDFVDETISINPIDYYYTNAIARASKVMSECRKIPKNFLFTGIEKAS